MSLPPPPPVGDPAARYGQQTTGLEKGGDGGAGGGAGFGFPAGAGGAGSSVRGGQEVSFEGGVEKETGNRESAVVRSFPWLRRICSFLL